MNSSPTKVTFFQDGAPECPIVQISGTDFHRSRALLHAISQMRQRVAGSFGLHELAGFEGCLGPKLIFELSDSSVGVHRDPDRNEFACKLSYDGWTQVEDSLAPFCEGDSTDHSFQWLDESSDISLLYSPSGGW
jgi:hypothetical protein